MSELIMCDRCKKTEFTDNRSEKGAMCRIYIEYTDGLSGYHLCKKCHKKFLTDFMRDLTPDDYDDIYGMEEE